MSLATKSGASAGHLVTITTNDARVHSAADWARGTAKQLVAIDPKTTPERLQASFKLRGAIASALHEGFSEVNAKMPCAVLDSLAREVADKVFDCAKGSPWEAHFADPQTRTSMALVIWRNIHDAAFHAASRE